MLTRTENIDGDSDHDIVDKFVYDTDTEVLLTATRDFGTGRLNLTTEFQYDAIGNVIVLRDPHAHSISWDVSIFEFDKERRMTKRTDTPEANTHYDTLWNYNASGRLISLQRQTGDPAHPYQTWGWGYSASGYVLGITDPSGNNVSLVYNHLQQVDSKTDGEGRKWQYAYDPIGRVSTVTDPMGNASETRTYTDNGMLAAIEDARTNVTEMAYDGFDRVDTRTYPDTTFEQFTYNANNQVLTLLTRIGDTIENTYDVLTRLSTRQPGSVLPLQTMTYDLAGKLINVNTPTVGGDPSSGDYGFEYDTAGRLLVQSMPNGDEVTYQLDKNGNRTRLAWPDAYYADYVFDWINRLTDIKLNGSSSVAVHFDYDDLSRRKAITYINGCVCSYVYEMNNDIRSLEHAFVGSSVNFRFHYNNANQVIQQSVSDDYGWTPAAPAVTAYATANNLNQYPSVGATSYEYDLNGNLTSGPLTASFDALNRLTQAISGSTTNSYWNDPLGRQAQKEVNSVKSGYLYDGAQLIAEYDDTPALVNRYIPGSGLDEILVQISGSDTTFLHKDRLGSVIAQTDDSGAVLNKYKYSPFGETPSLTGTAFGFTGQRYDAEIGLYNYKARYYSPAVGRFLQPDPLGYEAGDMSLYAYVGNDPVNYVDSSGTTPLGTLCREAAIVPSKPESQDR